MTLRLARPAALLLPCLIGFALASCGDDPSGGARRRDFAIAFDDDGGFSELDFAMPGEETVCGDTDPSCNQTTYSPDDGEPFPLERDPNPVPDQSDSGLSRDPMGYLGLDVTSASFNFLWIANAGQGSTSKIDTRTVREVARYSTVTCYSLPGKGSKSACDGKVGCCSVDDHARWLRRKSGQPAGDHEAVQLQSNSPSRTSVDVNGDLFISNRAFGGVPSVTKIANDKADCIDHNKNGRIDTSSDADGDGLIETDCNGNGMLDDIDDVKNLACTNGRKQEYFGVQDECIVWTTNSLPRNATGRPLGLGPGAQDSGASDAWAGSYENGNFVRIDGTSGTIKDEAQLKPGCQPYGLAIDSSGYGWSPDLGSGELCYFDTRKVANTGVAKDPPGGKMQGYGITLDRDQNIWLGMRLARYTPDRSQGFNKLGQGWWTTFSNQASGIGIAADSRSPQDYFVWWCSGGSKVVRVPASDIPIVKMDQTLAANGWQEITMPCYGAGVDSDQNVWGINTSVATRGVVDKMGTIKQPMQAPPVGQNKCPAGDACPTNAGAYTYSDFTGFGLRNFTRPTGTWSIVYKGCTDGTSTTATEWHAVSWDAEVPPNTTLAVRARSGPTPKPDQSWGAWTSEGTASPLTLLGGALVPNLPGEREGAYLQVEVVFKSSDRKSTPKLKSLGVGFKCPVIQ